MSILGNIFNKIFHHPTAQQASQGQQQSQNEGQAAPGAPEQRQPAQPSSPAGASQQPVDVEAVLTQMAGEKGGGGNWRTSIVDLLKLLDLDSSLDARKQLANELNVHVAGDGSAEENIALHKAVMQQLAANGGKVPDSLKQ